MSRLAANAKSILDGGSAQQYGALCFRAIADDGVEVLLVTTRETGRRTIPKGWPIEGLAPHEVAEREAWEEAGVKGRAKKRIFGHFVYIKSLPDGKQVPAFVEVDLLKARDTKKRFPECGERTIVWMRPAEAASLVNEAASLVNEPELRGLLRRMEKHAA